MDCEKPCKTLPYDPRGTAEKEIVEMWKGVERTALINDVEPWIPGFTDDFVFVTPDGGRPPNKADRPVRDEESVRCCTHSVRRARMGSMEAARRAGITAARAADAARTVMARRRIGGS